MSMRFISSIGASAVIAFLLFLLMSTLISGGRDDANYRQSGIILDFIRITKDEIIKRKIRQKPDEPEPPKKLQRPPRIDVSKHTNEPPRPMPLELFDIDVSLGGGDGSFAGVWNSSLVNPDRDAILNVWIIPLYPRGALLRGVEGWVELAPVVLPTFKAPEWITRKVNTCMIHSGALNVGRTTEATSTSSQPTMA